MDLIHKGLKVLSHHRYSLIGVGLGIAAVVLSACSMTAPSPIDGKPVTMDALADQAEVYAARLAAEKAKRERDLAGELQALKDSTAAQLQALKDKYTDLADAAGVDAAEKQAQFSQAEAEIARKEAIASGIFTVVKELAGSAASGGLTGGLATGALITAAGLFVDNRRKDRVIRIKKGE